MTYLHEYREKRVMPDTDRYISLPPVDNSLWGIMEMYLSSRGLDYDLALVNGWYPSCSAGDSHVRIIIPCESEKIKGTYWQGRAVSDKTKGALRYTSPHAARQDAYVLVRPRFGGRGKAALVEGPMDALAASERWLESYALMGNTPNHEVLDAVAKKLPAETWAIADKDAIGAMLKVVTYLNTKGAKVILVECPAKDLAAMPRDERMDWLGHVIGDK